MNQGSCSIFSAGAFMTRHDSVLFQKAETTGLRTGSLSCIPVLYLSPGVPPEFPPLISCITRTNPLSFTALRLPLMGLMLVSPIRAQL